MAVSWYADEVDKNRSVGYMTLPNMNHSSLREILDLLMSFYAFAASDSLSP